jgi:hypothetical protein
MIFLLRTLLETSLKRKLAYLFLLVVILRVAWMNQVFNTTAFLIVVAIALPPIAMLVGLRFFPSKASRWALIERRTWQEWKADREQIKALTKVDRIKKEKLLAEAAVNVAKKKLAKEGGQAVKARLKAELADAKALERKAQAEAASARAVADADIEIERQRVRQANAESHGARLAQLEEEAELVLAAQAPRAAELSSAPNNGGFWKGAAAGAAVTFAATHNSKPEPATTKKLICVKCNHIQFARTAREVGTKSPETCKGCRSSIKALHYTT